MGIDTKPELMTFYVYRTLIKPLDEAVRKIPGGRLPAEVTDDSKAAGEPRSLWPAPALAMAR